MFMQASREPMMLRVSVMHLPEGFPQMARAAMPEGVQAPARRQGLLEVAVLDVQGEPLDFDSRALSVGTDATSLELGLVGTPEALDAATRVHARSQELAWEATVDILGGVGRGSGP